MTEAAGGAKAGAIKPSVVGYDQASTGMVINYNADQPTMDPTPGTVTVQAHGGPGGVMVSNDADGKGRPLTAGQVAGDIKAVSTGGTVYMAVCFAGAGQVVIGPGGLVTQAAPAAQNVANGLGGNFVVMGDRATNGHHDFPSRIVDGFSVVGGRNTPTQWLSFTAGTARAPAEITPLN